jgi:hypothetical protein
MAHCERRAEDIRALVSGPPDRVRSGRSPRRGVQVDAKRRSDHLPGRATAWDPGRDATESELAPEPDACSAVATPAGAGGFATETAAAAAARTCFRPGSHTHSAVATSENPVAHQNATWKPDTTAPVPAPEMDCSRMTASTASAERSADLLRGPRQDARVRDLGAVESDVRGSHHRHGDGAESDAADQQPQRKLPTVARRVDEGKRHGGGRDDEEPDDGERAPIRSVSGPAI